MSSSIQKQLNEVDQLIISGKYRDAMNILEKISSKNLVETDRINYLLHKISALNLLGEYQEALDLIDDTLGCFKKKTSTEKIDILLQKGITFVYLEKKEEIKVLIKQIEANLRQLEEISAKNKSKIKASIARLNLFTISARAEPKKYMKFAKNFNKFAVISEDDVLINASLIFLAYAHYRLDESKKCFDLLKEAFQHAITFSYKLGQELSLWELSRHESDRVLSLDYAEKAIVLHEEIGSKRHSYSRYVYMGCRYVQNCNFEKALVSLNKAEKVLGENDLERYSIYFVYARLFSLKGEFNLAYENILRAQKIAKESNQLMYAQSYYDLLLLAIDLEKLELADKHQQKLQVLSKELDDEEIQLYSLLASALILKANKGIRDWSKSITILEEILENEPINSTILIDATLNLCELLIREIELIGEIDLLDSIQTHLSTLQEIAENQKIYWLLIEILRLKSQISLLVFDIKKARELLEEALRVSQDKGIQKLTVEIINEQIEIEEKIAIWEKLREIGAPLLETLKHVHLLNNIVEINQKTTTVKSCGGEKNTIEYRKLFTLKI